MIDFKTSTNLWCDVLASSKNCAMSCLGGILSVSKRHTGLGTLPLEPFVQTS